jgi:short-subunit dehydrogenase
MANLRRASVVITGASSGIGRATALAFARAGARVTIAARRSSVLAGVAHACERQGAEALAVPTDVTIPDAVSKLARAAVAEFGGIDIWINNAGVGVFGPYTDAPLEYHRRTIEVNLLGAMYGAYAALPVFMRQGHGTLINTISLGAWAPAPYAAAYTASKFGLRGFAASLRQELGEYPHIHVCGVFPAIVDTPGLEHGANVSGREIDPGPFLYAPEDVANTILSLARSPRDEVAVGWPARAAQVAYSVARGPTERLSGAFVRRALARAEPAPLTEGALLRPVGRGLGVSGGWRERKGLASANRVGLALAAAAALVLGTSAAAAYAGRVGSRRHGSTTGFPSRGRGDPAYVPGGRSNPAGLSSADA